MARQKADNTGKYLYAIIAGETDRVFGPFGIDGGLAYSISDGRIAAVISDFSDWKIRPERRHLAAHQQVLKKLLQESTPLPMSFGIVARGEKAIRKILSTHQKAFMERLNHVASSRSILCPHEMQLIFMSPPRCLAVGLLSASELAAQ